jgi:hypothetical protein
VLCRFQQHFSAPFTGPPSVLPTVFWPWPHTGAFHPGSIYNRNSRHSTKAVLGAAIKILEGKLPEGMFAPKNPDFHA